MSRCDSRTELIGYVGVQPEVRTLDNGQTVATFTMATTEKWKGKDGEWKEDTQWHRIIAWRWLAERAREQLKKGTYCRVIGRLKYRSYEKDGHPVYVTEIIATDLHSLERRPKKDAPATDSVHDNAPDGYATGTVNPDGSVTPDDDDMAF